MNKIFKKFLVVILVLTIVFTSTISSFEKTNAAGITLGTLVLGAVIVGGICIGCDYISNPDKYADLRDSMNDFANTTVENQKKIYEIEKANFQMVMDKAVDAGVGTCLVGPNGVHITAKQLQGQEYPAFDTWKGYKEKESEKPKSSLWDKFKMVTGLADFICKLWPDGKSPLPDGGSGSEQRYYTGDDGYIDRETGQLSVSFSSTNSWYDYSSTDKSEWGIKNDKFTVSWTQKIDKNARVCTWVNGGFIYYGRIPTDTWYETFKYRYGCELYRFVYGTSWGSNSVSVNNYSYHKHVWSSSKKEYVDTVDSSLSYSVNGIPYSCHLDENDNPVYRMWDNLSTNIPVFENSDYAKAYMNNGSLEGLINGAPEQGLTPTEAPVLPSTVSPVRQYVNYFANTFSPSVMPYYVNYNIVNNWDGDDTTFNINDYTGVLLPTLTPAPDADGKDTNVTNNILIVHTNILTEINETVTNIYNFFQIDVDYITEELQVDSDENPTGFDNLKNLLSEFESAFPADKFDAVTQELDLLYPKITIKVPKALDKFLKVGDDKIILEDGVMKIVLCDFNEYAIYFVRFRKFLEIVLRIGLIFYLLKELTVVFTVA